MDGEITLGRILSIGCGTTKPFPLYSIGEGGGHLGVGLEDDGRPIYTIAGVEIASEEIDEVRIHRGADSSIEYTAGEDSVV